MRAVFFQLFLFVALTSAFFVVHSIATTDLNLEGSNTDPSHLESDAIESSITESQQTPEQKFRTMLGKTPGRRLHKIGQGNSREDIEALRQVFQQSTYDWSNFKPKPIVEPNCYIEVQVPQRVPGRCTKLGGQIPACQSQDLLTIDYTTCGP